MECAFAFEPSRGQPARFYISVDGPRSCGRMSVSVQIEYELSVKMTSFILFAESAWRRRPRKLTEIGSSFPRSKDCWSFQSKAAICASIEKRLRSPRVTPCSPGVSSRSSATRFMRSCSPTSLKDAMRKAARGRQFCPEAPCERTAPFRADRQHRRHSALLRVPHCRRADGGASGRIPPGRCRPGKDRGDTPLAARCDQDGNRRY